MLGIGLAEKKVDLMLASGLIVLCNILGIFIGSAAMIAGLYWISKE
jgi:hypothetical protein